MNNKQQDTHAAIRSATQLIFKYVPHTSTINTTVQTKDEDSHTQLYTYMDNTWKYYKRIYQRSNTNETRHACLRIPLSGCAEHNTYFNYMSTPYMVHEVNTPYEYDEEYEKYYTNKGTRSFTASQTHPYIETE